MDLGHQVPPTRGRTPMHITKAVPVHIIAELLELAALTRLPLRVGPDESPSEKQGSHSLPFRVKIGVDPKLRRKPVEFPAGPEPQRRSTLDRDELERKETSFCRRRLPRDLCGLRRLRQSHSLNRAFRGKRTREH